MLVDLNADVGEGFGAWRMGDDVALLEHVTSASVACGFHAGDPTIMRATCAQAVARGVRIGAHVAYPDREGFGRRRMELAPGQLADGVVYQLGALAACARAEGAEVRYVKAHGALYTAALEDDALAAELAAGVRAVDPGLAVLTVAGSALWAAAASAGLARVAEGFADRGYARAGRLLGRGRDGALLDAEQAVAQSLAIADAGRVRSAEDGWVAVEARSLCVHSDTPGAADIAARVAAALRAAGHELAPFA